MTCYNTDTFPKDIQVNIHSFIYDYGEKVPGYEVGMVNEKEVRATAGILFLLGMIVLFVGIGYNHIIVARFYLAFIFIDMTIRIINPSYSPALLFGRMFIQNQKPEYVAAMQKRFAWILGWFIALPMMNWFVLHWDITFYKVLICVLCLGLLFMESALSICVGCKLYTFFTRKKAQHCPGGVCEVRTKEPIQTFNLAQKIIATAISIALAVGLYLFMAKTESKTFFGEFLHELVLTKAQLNAEKEAKLDAEFENDDDF